VHGSSRGLIEVKSRGFLGRNGEENENSQSGKLVSGPRCEVSTSEYGSRACRFSIRSVETDFLGGTAERYDDDHVEKGYSDK
jgi:hypothetical protein